MFGSLGAPEIILIFIVALLVFGPRRLPEIGRKIGGIVRELRRATGDFRSSVEREIGFDPSQSVEEARRARRDILSVISDPLRDAADGAADAMKNVREAVILPPGRAPEGALPRGPGQATPPAASGPGSDDPARFHEPLPAPPGPPTAADPARSEKDAPPPRGETPE